MTQEARRSLSRWALLGSLWVCFSCSWVIPIDDEYYLGSAPAVGGGPVTPGGTSGSSGGGYSKGLLHHYTFDDGEGSAVADRGSLPIPGTLVAAELLWKQFGRLGGSLELGDGHYLDFTSAVASTQDITIALWILPKRPEFRVVFDKQSFLGAEGFRLVLAPTPAENTPEVRIGGFAAQVEVQASTSIPVDAWSHLALTFDAAGSEGGEDVLSIWINGQLDTTSVQSFAYPFLNETAPFRVGTPSENPDLPGLVGEVDDLRIYERALRDAEISALVTQLEP